jgi:hypothetical protein
VSDDSHVVVVVVVIVGQKFPGEKGSERWCDVMMQ